MILLLALPTKILQTPYVLLFLLHLLSFRHTPHPFDFKATKMAKRHSRVSCSSEYKGKSINASWHRFVFSVYHKQAFCFIWKVCLWVLRCTFLYLYNGSILLFIWCISEKVHLKNSIIVLSLSNKPLTCITSRTLGEGGRENNITIKTSIPKYPYLQLTSTLTMSTAQMTRWIFSFSAAFALVHAVDCARPCYEHAM